MIDSTNIPCSGELAFNDVILKLSKFMIHANLPTFKHIEVIIVDCPVWILKAAKFDRRTSPPPSASMISYIVA